MPKQPNNPDTNPDSDSVLKTVGEPPGPELPEAFNGAHRHQRHMDFGDGCSLSLGAWGKKHLTIDPAAIRDINDLQDEFNRRRQQNYVDEFKARFLTFTEVTDHKVAVRPGEEVIVQKARSMGVTEVVARQGRMFYTSSIRSRDLKAEQAQAKNVKLLFSDEVIHEQPRQHGKATAYRANQTVKGTIEWLAQRQPMPYLIARQEVYDMFRPKTDWEQALAYAYFAGQRSHSFPKEQAFTRPGKVSLTTLAVQQLIQSYVKTPTLS